MEIEYEEIDDSLYVGGEDDGCYVRLGQAEGAFYVTITVDCETSHFVCDIETDAGPFRSEDEAREYGRGVALSWCMANGVWGFA